jgi:hypothetical protein
MQTTARTTTSAIIELVEAFDFEKVEKVMIALDWKWAFSKELRIPTIDEMRDTCFNLLIYAERDNDTVSSGGFEASYKINDYDKEVFTLKFIAAWNYSRV